MESIPKILILLGVLQFSSCDVNISGVEQQLEKSTRSFFEREKNLARMVGLCDSYLMFASSNLKASNAAGNLTKIFDDGRILMKDLKSINNHDSFESLANFSTCEYIVSRQSSVEFDLSRFNSISKDVMANLTKLLQLRNKITAGFASNFKFLLKFKSKSLTVIYTIREFGRSANEYLNYLRQLDFGKKNFQALKIYLNATATSSNCSMTNSSFQENGKQIDAKLENFEEGLRGAHSIALALIRTALKSVTTTANESSTLRLNIQDLMSTLTETNTVKSFPLLMWPKLPDNPGRNIKLKLRSTMEKKKEYSALKDDCVGNKSRISLKRKAFVMQNVSSTVKKVQTTASLVNDILIATTDVETYYNDYNKILNTTIAQVEKIYDQIVENATAALMTSTSTSLPVTILSSTTSAVLTSTSTMEPTTTTSTTTSTSTSPSTSTTSTLPPTTTTSTTTTTTPFTSTTSTSTLAPPTTTVPPCGIFVAYDTVNNPNGPAINGFAAGVYFYDNSTQYIGYGKNPPVVNAILTNPPGALFPLGATTFQLDNKTAFYLLNHPDLVWVSTSVTAMMNIATAVKPNVTVFPFLFGRVKYNGAYRVGKLHAGAGVFSLWIGTATGEVSFQNSDIIEVLTCDSTPKTSTITTTTTLAPTSTTSTATSTTTLAPTTSTTTLAPTTSSTTPVTTTMQPCGTFISYNIVNNPNGPAINGFAGGVYYKDLSTQYVGYGDYTSCTSQNPAGGFIQTKPPRLIGNCGGTVTTNNSLFYVLKSPNLKYVPTDMTSLLNVPNAIKRNGPGYPLMFGRFLYLGTYHIGKFYLGSGNTGLFYVTIDGIETFLTTGFEVLTCSTSSVTPTVSLPPCGTFVNYDALNDPNGPANFGFPTGMFADGMMGYAGVGNNSADNQNPSPGTLTLKTPGRIYMASKYGPQIDSSQPKYLLNHPNLVWVQTNNTAVVKVNNTIRMQSGSFNVMIGRVLFNGSWYVSKVHYENNELGLYISEYGNLTNFMYDVNYEVLTCQPI